MIGSSAGGARETGRSLDGHYRFILWLIPALARLPRSQKFLLGDRIRNSAVDVTAALIEATYTKREFRTYLVIRRESVNAED